MTAASRLVAGGALLAAALLVAPRLGRRGAPEAAGLGRAGLGRAGSGRAGIGRAGPEGVVKAPTGARPAGRLERRHLSAAAAGLLVALAVGGWAGLLVGPLAAGGALVWLTRRASRAQDEANRRAEADLPFGADLLAAALRAGAPPEAAVRTVGTALGGPLGERLVLVGRALRLGTPAAPAWADLGSGPGAVRLARAAARTEHSGTALAGALNRVADDLRAARLIAAEGAAHRAGVLIVLPLGLCFLPAFVLAGLVPVIVAVLGDVLSP